VSECTTQSISNSKTTVDGSPRYPKLPGVRVYGKTQDDAIAKVKALSLRILADRIDHGEPVPETDQLFSVAP
jgi:hypothetical protein